MNLTRAEKIHAAKILDSHGATLKTIGERIGSDPTTVQGWKSNGWKPGGTHPKRRVRALRPAPVSVNPACTAAT
ncbi:hypothetical protein [Streptomyces sp. NPDC001415]